MARRNQGAAEELVHGGVKVYDNQDLRDEALEPQFVRPCDCCPSLLSSCYVHREALVHAYMSWAREQNVPHVYSARMLVMWEQEKFGRPAYPTAHALLMYAVKVAVFGDPYRRKPKATESDTGARPGLVAMLKGGVQPMPAARMSARQWNDARNAAAACLPPGDRE